MDKEGDLNFMPAWENYEPLALTIWLSLIFASLITGGAWYLHLKGDRDIPGFYRKCRDITGVLWEQHNWNNHIWSVFWLTTVIFWLVWMGPLDLIEPESITTFNRSFGPGDVITVNADQTSGIAIGSSKVEKLAVFKEPTWVFWWDPRIANRTIESYAHKTVYSGIPISPITANPGIQELDCDARIEFGGTPENYVLFRNSRWSTDPETTLRYYLFEFGKKYHGEMTQFYNPEDEKQQQAFDTLFRTFIEPELVGSGVKLKNAYFRRKFYKM